DAVIVTYLAHRTTDAHFAHHPARLIDALHLDPIPLKADNPDVIKSALFTAIFDFIATRSPGTIPNAVERLNIIGTGGSSEGPWEAKIIAVSQFLTANRLTVRAYLMAAVAAVSSAEADNALDAALTMFRGLTVNLQGAMQIGGSAAHWIQQNNVPAASPDFNAVLQISDELRSDVLQISSRTAVVRAIDELLSELATTTPSAPKLMAVAGDVQKEILAISPPVAELFPIMGKVHTIVQKFSGLTLVGGFRDVRLGYEALQNFAKSGDAGDRRMSLHYFHSLL